MNGIHDSDKCSYRTDTCLSIVGEGATGTAGHTRHAPGLNNLRSPNDLCDRGPICCECQATHAASGRLGAATASATAECQSAVGKPASARETPCPLHTAVKADEDSLGAAKAAFLKQYGQQYGYNGWLDANYQQELGHRLGAGQHYLDWTGSGQYTTSQIRKCMTELTDANFGNPHSRNPSSARSTKEVRYARTLVLQHFNADPEEYDVVFTKGATEALKMISEYFPWTHHSTFTYTQANHKSVLGMGTYAKKAGAQLHCLTEHQMKDWLTSGSDTSSTCDEVICHLVAYPRKDNYEGVLYPEEWVEQIHAKSNSKHQYLVVLDAAAHVPTHALDISAVKPDFLPVSFYKMFGYPSGLGALLVRKEASKLLNKVYFGGGAVDYCTAEDVWHVFSPLPAAWEDGTVGFLSIAGLKFGFQQLQQLGGMQAIEHHVESLRSWTYEQLQQLQHSNGTPMIRLFGKHECGKKHQSGIFQFQVLCPRGAAVPPVIVEQAAAAAGLHMRSGCNCNPGKCLPNLGITPEEERMRAASHHKGQMLTVMRPASQVQAGCFVGEQLHLPSSSADGTLADNNPANLEHQATPESEQQLVPVQLPIGSVRASLGYLSTFEDVHAFVVFLMTTFRDDKAVKLLHKSAQELELDWPADAYC